MKKFYTLFILALVASSVAAQIDAGAVSSAKLKRFNKELEIADRKYDHFHYQSAVDHYKRAIEMIPSAKVDLKLANSYRKLNDPENAEFWYKQAIKRNAHLAEEDHLHLAEVLKANKKYDEALAIFEK